MSLIPVFTAVKNQLLANIATVFTAFNPNINDSVPPFIHMWNRPLFNSWKEQAKKSFMTESGGYSVLFPAIMIEFLNTETTQLGDGEQIYLSLVVRIHIFHWQLDAGDGTMEQNLTVYAIADTVQQCLQKFYAGGLFIRSKQGLDQDYGNLYHYTIDYETTYVDTLMQEPVNGQTITGVTPEITVDYNPAPFIKP